MKKDRFIVERQRQRYGIRKVVGKTASVLLGTTLFGVMLNSGTTVHAEVTQNAQEQTSQQSDTTQSNKQEAANSEATKATDAAVTKSTTSPTQTGGVAGGTIDGAQTESTSTTDSKKSEATTDSSKSATTTLNLSTFSASPKLSAASLTESKAAATGEDRDITGDDGTDYNNGMINADKYGKDTISLNNDNDPAKATETTTSYLNTENEQWTWGTSGYAPGSWGTTSIGKDERPEDAANGAYIRDITDAYLASGGHLNEGERRWEVVWNRQIGQQATSNPWFSLILSKDLEIKGDITMTYTHLDYFTTDNGKYNKAIVFDPKTGPKTIAVINNPGRKVFFYDDYGAGKDQYAENLQQWNYIDLQHPEKWDVSWNDHVGNLAKAYEDILRTARTGSAGNTYVNQGFTSGTDNTSNPIQFGSEPYKQGAGWIDTKVEGDKLVTKNADGSPVSLIDVGTDPKYADYALNTSNPKAAMYLGDTYTFMYNTATGYSFFGMRKAYAQFTTGKKEGVSLPDGFKSRIIAGYKSFDRTSNFRRVTEVELNNDTKNYKVVVSEMNHTNDPDLPERQFEVGVKGGKTVNTSTSAAVPISPAGYVAADTPVDGNIAQPKVHNMVYTYQTSGDAADLTASDFTLNLTNGTATDNAATNPLAASLMTLAAMPAGNSVTGTLGNGINYTITSNYDAANRTMTYNIDYTGHESELNLNVRNVTVIEGKDVPDDTTVAESTQNYAKIQPTTEDHGLIIDENGNLTGAVRGLTWTDGQTSQTITIPVTAKGTNPTTNKEESVTKNVVVTVQRALTANATQGQAVEGHEVASGQKVITSNLPNTTFTPQETNGLSVDKDGNLIGTPTDLTWTDGQTSQTVFIPVNVSNGNQQLDNPVLVPVEVIKSITPSVQLNTVIAGDPVGANTVGVNFNGGDFTVTDSDTVNGLKIDENGHLTGTPTITNGKNIQAVVIHTKVKDNLTQDVLKRDVQVVIVNKLTFDTTTKTVVEGQAAPTETVVTPNITESSIYSTATNGLSVDQNGNLTGTPTITDWKDGENSRDVEIPVVVTNPIGNILQRATGNVTVTVIRKLDATTNPATVTNNKPAESTPVVVPNMTGSTISSTPTNGLSVDENGNLTGTPSITDWKDGETERTVDIPVTVTNEFTDKDGNKTPQTVTKTVTVTVQRDLNVKVTTPNPVPENKPVIATKVVEPNLPDSEITSTPTNGLSVNKDGNLTGTPTITDWKTGEKERTVNIPVTVKNGDQEINTTVTVTVTRSQSGIYEPQGQDQTVNKNETPDASKSIANKNDLPDDTKYDWKTPVDTSTSGDKPATVVVTYPDKTTDEVNVTVHVNNDAESHEPQGQDQTVNKGETPDASKSIANKDDLPDGTKYDWKTPVDTSTSGDKDATVVVTYPDKTTDEVNVTIHVNDDAKSYEPQGQNQNVNKNETPDASKSIANKDDLPDGTKYDWKTPVDTSNSGDKPATVVVTYPDKTTDEVDVTVHVNDDSQTDDLQGQDQTVARNEQPDPEKSVANKDDLPAGTTYSWKDPIDTSTSGDKSATLVATYPDGSKDETNVTIHVLTDAEANKPQGKDQTVNKGDEPKAEDSIANKKELPDGTSYDWKTPVDTSTSGDKPATVVVTYPDKTTDEVNVTIHVNDDSESNQPQGKDQTVNKGAKPDAGDSIANKDDMPDGTSYSWKDPIDTSTSGDKPATVVVTYPDKTTDEVNVTVHVNDDAATYEPQGQDQTVNKNQTPDASKSIANKDGLPSGTEYGWKDPIDTSTSGDKPATVVVTYPDKTTDEVNVTVHVNDDAATYEPQGQDQTVNKGDKPKAEDSISNKKDLPDGTNYDWKTPVDTSTKGDKDATVVVTYPDGSTDEVPVKVHVNDDSETYEPQGQDQTVDKGQTPKAEDSITNKDDLPKDTHYDWKDPIDTTTPGDKNGTVVVTYPDGSKDEVDVNIHVNSDADKYDPQGKDQTVNKGDEPKAEDSIANKDDLP
ncbi:Rib/alpha/Esp surface antigen-like repeat protein, partial [Lactobacillus colini]